MFINLYFRRSTPVATAETCSFKVVLQIATCSGGRWPPKRTCNRKIKVPVPWFYGWEYKHSFGTIELRLEWLLYYLLGDKHENIYFRRSTPVATAAICSFKVVLQIATCSDGRWPPKQTFSQKNKIISEKGKKTWLLGLRVLSLWI